MHGLSGQLQRKQLPFFDKLRLEVARLSKEIEEVVGETLQISLLPVAVIFELPPQIPLDKAIEVGVKSESKTYTTSRDERYLSHKILWVWPVYKTRTVYDTSTVTKHEVDTVAIHRFWQEQIGGTMKKTKEKVDDTFKQEILVTIQYAEQELRNFSDNYVSIIKRSMDEASQGEQQRQHLLEQVERRLQQLTELLKTITDYKAVLDQLKAGS